MFLGVGGIAHRRQTERETHLLAMGKLVTFKACIYVLILEYKLYTMKYVGPRLIQEHFHLAERTSKRIFLKIFRQLRKLLSVRNVPFIVNLFIVIFTHLFRQLLLLPRQLWGSSWVQTESCFADQPIYIQACSLVRGSRLKCWISVSLEPLFYLCFTFSLDKQSLLKSNLQQQAKCNLFKIPSPRLQTDTLCCRGLFSAFYFRVPACTQKKVTVRIFCPQMFAAMRLSLS